MIRKLIWRNLWRNKRRTLITTSSVTFAVVLAVVTQALVKGTFGNLIDSKCGCIKCGNRGHLLDLALTANLVKCSRTNFRIVKTRTLCRVKPLQDFVQCAGQD